MLQIFRARREMRGRASLHACWVSTPRVLLNIHGLSQYHRIAPSPWLLFYHFFSVALYTIYILFTRPQTSTVTEKGTTLTRPSISQWPALTVMSVKVVSFLHIRFVGHFSLWGLS